MANAKKNFIKDAIKRPGALTARAKSHNRSIFKQAQVDIRSGSTLQKRQAGLFLRVLRPASLKKKAK